MLAFNVQILILIIKILKIVKTNILLKANFK